MGSVIDKNPWIGDFADEFAKDFTDSFTRHYAKAHKAAWSETLKKAVELTKTLTRREVASCLIKYTELTHGEIGQCCKLDKSEVEKPAQED
ncbi:MAG: hypothetical protein IJT58_07145 [Synergistaceae bacterium]|nr:hypothetical protein [Synergistaceae bacterium]